MAEQKCPCDITLIAALVMKYHPCKQIELRRCKACSTHQISVRATGTILRCAGCATLQAAGRLGAERVPTAGLEFGKAAAELRE